MSHEDTIRAFYGAWAAGDIEGALEFCTDDVVAVNVPIGPVDGKAAVREFLEKFGAGMSGARYDIHHVLERGDMAMLEGQENYEKNGSQVALPYMAVFFFEGERVREWRDYFDYATLRRQLG